MARNRLVRAWTVALLWIFFAVPVLWMQVPRYSGAGRALLISVAWGMGFAALTWSLWETWRWRRFGQSCLHLAALPVSAGEALRGEVSSRSVFPVPPLMEVALRCYRYVSGRSRNSRTRVSTLWESVQTVQSIRTEDLRVPLHFNIPSNGEPTHEQGNTVIKWVLSVQARVPGVDYLAEFEVPVKQK